MLHLRVDKRLVIHVRDVHGLLQRDWNEKIFRVIPLEPKFYVLMFFFNFNYFEVTIFSESVHWDQNRGYSQNMSTACFNDIKTKKFSTLKPEFNFSIFFNLNYFEKSVFSQSPARSKRDILKTTQNGAWTNLEPKEKNCSRQNIVYLLVHGFSNRYVSYRTVNYCIGYCIHHTNDMVTVTVQAVKYVTLIGQLAVCMETVIIVGLGFFFIFFSDHTRKFTSRVFSREGKLRTNHTGVLNLLIIDSPSFHRKRSIGQLSDG